MKKNSRVKVLQIQLRYNVSSSDLAEQIVAGLPREDYEVTTLFLRGRPEPGGLLSMAERSIYFECTKSELKGISRWLTLRRLYNLCRQEGFDVVIAHRYKPISMMMWIGRFLKGTIVIGIQHSVGDYDRLMRRVEARLLISDRFRIVGVSRSVSAYLVEKVGAFTRNNTLTINNAIDISRARQVMLDAEHARQCLGIPDEKRVVGCIGRLVPVKGHALLVQAFASIAERYPDAIIAIIGEGRSRAELELLISQYGLHEKVLLLGAHDDAVKYVRVFDIFAMPSYSEGLPLALLEAIAGERYVLGSDIPSMLSILQDCGGSTFRSGDSEDLADKLTVLLDSSSDQLQAKGQSGFEYLCKNHAIDDFKNSYRRLLEGMLGQRGDA